MYRQYLASLARQQVDMASSNKIKILLVLGSIRDGRQGLKVANFVRKQLENRNFDVTFYDLLEMNFPMVKQPVHFLGPERSGAPQILLDCEKQIRETDAFVMVSAEYNNSIPASLKNFLDAFPDGAYGCKPSGLVSYSMGPYGGLCSVPALRTTLGVLSSPCVARICAIPFVQNAFDEAGNVLNENLNSDLNPMLEQLEWMANAAKNHKDKVGLPTSSFMFQ